MVIDLNKHLGSYSNVVKLYELNKEQPLKDVITKINIAIEIELIVICYYLLRHLGGNEFIEEKIEQLKKFYKYTSIIPIKEVSNEVKS